MCDSFLISRIYRIYPREESDHPTNKLDRLQKKRNGATWRWNILKYTESNSHHSVLIYHWPQCRAMSIWCKRLQKYLKKCKSYVNIIKPKLATVPDLKWHYVLTFYNLKPLFQQCEHALLHLFQWCPKQTYCSAVFLCFLPIVSLGSSPLFDELTAAVEDLAEVDRLYLHYRNMSRCVTRYCRSNDQDVPNLK